MHVLRTTLIAASLTLPTIVFSTQRIAAHPALAPVAHAFNPQLAIEYGNLINLAYTMYGRVTPQHEFTPPYNGLPPQYNFIAWVRMNDFTPSGKIRPKFYGIVVQRKSDPDRFILALRGTDSGIEWWDDFTSIIPVPAGSFPGKVGDGFARIFDSMEVLDSSGRATDEFGRGFVKEIAAAIARRLFPRTARLSARDQATEIKRITIEVTGHSLGAALATLYVAANARDMNFHISRIYTFASPLVGDAGFVAAFERLHVNSWRIADPYDVVTVVPPIGFKHVQKLESVNPGDWVNRTPICLHSMITYLYLIRPANLLDKSCAWLPSVPGPNMGGHSS